MDEGGKSLDYVDPERIYLGGHSVGGTLAMLVAAMDQNPFRAVFAFGPAAHVGVYGPEALPFDSESEVELSDRAPMLYLDSIGVDTFVIEATPTGTESPSSRWPGRRRIRSSASGSSRATTSTFWLP